MDAYVASDLALRSLGLADYSIVPTLQYSEEANQHVFYGPEPEMKEFIPNAVATLKGIHEGISDVLVHQPVYMYEEKFRDKDVDTGSILRELIDEHDKNRKRGEYPLFLTLDYLIVI